MQKQIKVNDIYCLLKGSYDGAYEKLRYVDDIFTARNVRGTLLVWDLPGDGWTPLSNADSVKTQKYKCMNKFRDKYNELKGKIYG